MGITNLFRNAALALSFVAATGATTAAALAEPSIVAQQQQWQQDRQGQQAPNATPYDSPDFTVPGNDVY